MKFLIIILFGCMSISPPPDFFEKQLRFPRVAKAYAEKHAGLVKLLTGKKVDASNFDLFIRAFKQEQQLEAWVKNKNQLTYTLLKTYRFTATSGLLGPKRRSGDLQIPEGVYRVTNFNPQSSYHLSFKINYPNESDLFFADSKNPGNDIYIHGSNVTIGCIPLGDDNIDELYLLAAKAQSAGGIIPIHIFPVQMNDKNFSQLRAEYSRDVALVDFWTNLLPVYKAFTVANKLPQVYTNTEGRYQIRK